MDHMNNTMPRHHKMMMHMTFYWGKEALVLFSGWPGSSGGMYVLALLVVFVLSFLVEVFSHSKFIKSGSPDLAAGVIQTIMHAVRTALAYMLMLAVMSFNVGILLVAVAGHAIGFLLFGSRAFHKSAPPDLPPMSC